MLADPGVSTAENGAERDRMGGDESVEGVSRPGQMVCDLCRANLAAFLDLQTQIALQCSYHRGFGVGDATDLV